STNSDLVTTGAPPWDAGTEAASETNSADGRSSRWQRGFRALCVFRGGALLRAGRTCVGRRPHNGPVPLARIAWLTTVGIAALTGIIVLLNGYTGYGVLSFVIAASAAINLR